MASSSVNSAVIHYFIKMLNSYSMPFVRVNATLNMARRDVTISIHEMLGDPLLHITQTFPIALMDRWSMQQAADIAYGIVKGALYDCIKCMLVKQQ